MGSDNSYYESYYNSINKRKNIGSKNTFNKKGINSNSLAKRITIELVGVLMLFCFLLICKVIVTPQTKAAYSFCTNMINKEYDYKAFINEVKNIDLDNMQENIINKIEKIRCSIIGQRTYEERLKEEFTLPGEAEITASRLYDEKNNKGVNIKQANDVYIKCAGEGCVKECRESKEYGKYILIDHGDGIQTRYSHVAAFLVQEEDAVGKGQSIAEGIKSQKDESIEYYFEILYMGENKNPQLYI